MTTESKPFLGRCKHEGCDYAVFAADEDIGKVDDLRHVLPGGAATMVQGSYGVLARCPENHRVFPLKRIEGTYSEDFKCDSRCLNAKRHKCTCSCGGLNHGRGHAVTPVVLNANARQGEIRRGVEAQGYDKTEAHVIAEQADDVRYPKQHLGEVDGKIYFDGKLMRRVESDDSTLYVFLTEVRTPITGELLGEAEIKWWKPSYIDDPGFGAGEIYKLKAKVKRHDSDPKWGKSTVVTYLEEI
jgi:hypothetical protein